MVLVGERAGGSIGIEDQGITNTAGDRIANTGSNTPQGTKQKTRASRVGIFGIKGKPRGERRSAAADGYWRRGRGDKADVGSGIDVVVIVIQVERKILIGVHGRSKAVAAVMIQMADCGHVVSALADRHHRS